jgi:hypothetical protein
MSWSSAVPSELEAFRRFCAEELTTDLGDPLEIESWQEQIVAPFLDGCRTNIAIVARRTASRASAARSVCSCNPAATTT